MTAVLDVCDGCDLALLETAAEFVQRYVVPLSLTFYHTEGYTSTHLKFVFPYMRKLCIIAWHYNAVSRIQRYLATPGLHLGYT